MLVKSTASAPRLLQFNVHVPERAWRKEKKNKKNKQSGLGECYSGGKVARWAAGRLYEAKKSECTGLPLSQGGSCKRVTCFCFIFADLSGEYIKGSMSNEKNHQFLLTQVKLKDRQCRGAGSLLSKCTHMWIVHLFWNLTMVILFSSKVL